MLPRLTPVTNDGRDSHEDVTNGEVYRFGPFRLLISEGRLLQDGHPVPLAPRPFETLAYLVRSAGRVVSKTELISHLWPDTFVTDDVLVQCVVDARRALGDKAKSPSYIETLPKRGYLFVAQVAREDSSATTARQNDDPPVVRADAASLKPPAPPIWRRRTTWTLGIAAAVLTIAPGFWGVWSKAAYVPEPSTIAVMPFVVIGAGDESAWLSDGLAELVRGHIGRRRDLNMVARHRVSAAVDRRSGGQPPTPEQSEAAARDLRAERMITGRLVRLDDRFELTARLTEVVSGRVLSEANLRGARADLLESVGELSAKLIEGGSSDETIPDPGRRAAAVGTRSIPAWQAYSEALSWHQRGGREGADNAERALLRATSFDPGFALAWLKLAEIRQWRTRWGFPAADVRSAIHSALSHEGQLPERDRLLLASMNARLVANDPGGALKLWEQLMLLYPSYAEEAGVPTLMADTLMQLGRWDELILKLEPRVESASMRDDQRGLLSGLLAEAFRRKGEFDRAIFHARRGVQWWPTHEGPAWLQKRARLGRMLLDAGRTTDARREFDAVAADPRADAVNITDAAWGFYMLGDRDTAMALVQRAIGISPDYGNAYHLRGWLQLRNNPAIAAGDLERAWSQTPAGFGAPEDGVVGGGDLAALYYAGVAWQRAGNPAAAHADFARVIEHCRRITTAGNVGPNPVAVWQARSFAAISRARLGERTQEPERLNGDDATYFLQSARLHAVEGDVPRAIRELRQALSVGARDLQHIEDDPNFSTLRGEPEFRDLMRSFRK